MLEDIWSKLNHISTKMVIIRANSIDHAKEIASTDPMHKSGARNFTVRPWLLNEGSIQVSLNYSTGKFKLK